MDERLPARRAVDGRRLGELARNILDARDVDDHHIAHKLPVHQHDQPPEAVFGREGDVHPEAEQKAVDDDLPDIAEHDAADEVGHEKDGAEEVGALHRAGEQHGEREGEQVDGDHRDDGEFHGEPQGVEEVSAAGKRLDVVGKPHPLGVGHRCKLGKREVDAHHERDEKRDGERDERRQREEGEILSQRF